MNVNAHDLLYPQPRQVVCHDAPVGPAGPWQLQGEAIPAWLREQLERATPPGDGPARDLTLSRRPPDLSACGEPVVPDQAYRLALHPDGGVRLDAPGPTGFQHGLMTLIQLLDAARSGAPLTAVTITDAPVFAVRGVQVDMARDFFPPLDYLMRLVDRCVYLKLNALWLYLENRFAAPGLEDMAGYRAMTPTDARRLSAYAAERGVDVVPATNGISHMEGWFRLERYVDLSDGPKHSYAVTTRPEVMELVTRYFDALADAFPSPNFHAGMDELLKTGWNPEAARAIETRGKPRYFAEHTAKIIEHLQSKGKRVWVWDDMLVGLNVDREDGFKEAFTEALERIPRDVVLTHWWYWTDKDKSSGRVHAPIMRRVGADGRPLAVAAGTQSVEREYPGVHGSAEVLRHMVRCGIEHRAFAFIQTQWSADLAMAYEAHWPLMALAAAFAWTGPVENDDALVRRLSFAVSGRTDNALANYLESLDRLDQFFARPDVALRGELRKTLFRRGPAGLWQRISPVFPPRRRREARALLDEADVLAQRLSGPDPDFIHAMRLPVVLYRTLLRVLDGFDEAWHFYHEAALIERDPDARRRFEQHLDFTMGRIREVSRALGDLQQHLAQLEAIGHTPYDACLLLRWQQRLDEMCALIRDVAGAEIGLPAFHKLLHPYDAVHLPNLKQFEIQNVSRPHDPQHPWPIRWVSRPDDGAEGT